MRIRIRKFAVGLAVAVFGLLAVATAVIAIIASVIPLNTANTQAIESEFLLVSCS